MKSVHRKDFIIAGVVEKAHGNKGEMRVRFEQNNRIKEWVFLEIHGKPVPFFVQSRSGTKESPVFMLEGIQSPVDAARLVGIPVLIPKQGAAKRMRVADLDVTGYRLFDHSAELGIITGVEEMPGQLLIHALINSNEVLIPAVQEFVLDIDDEEKIVYVALPPGLIEL